MDIHKIFGKEAPTEGGEAVTVNESSSATGIESNADEVRGQKGIKAVLPLGIIKNAVALY